MQFWKALQWKVGSRGGDHEDASVSPAEEPPPLSPSDLASAVLTPNSLQNMIDMGVVDAAARSLCSYRESLGLGVNACSSCAVVICGACGHGTCLDTWHLYCRFGTLRGGSPHDRLGAKFFYYCRECRNFLCTRCLGIDDDYPCPPEYLERHVFQCGRCSADVLASRLDRADLDDFADVLRDLPSAMLPMAPS